MTFHFYVFQNSLRFYSQSLLFFHLASKNGASFCLLTVALLFHCSGLYPLIEYIDVDITIMLRQISIFFSISICYSLQFKYNTFRLHVLRVVVNILTVACLNRRKLTSFITRVFNWEVIIIILMIFVPKK